MCHIISRDKINSLWVDHTRATHEEIKQIIDKKWK
jgi:hypothetical protein